MKEKDVRYVAFGRNHALATTSEGEMVCLCKLVSLCLNIMFTIYCTSTLGVMVMQVLLAQAIKWYVVVLYITIIVLYTYKFYLRTTCTNSVWLLQCECVVRVMQYLFNNSLFFGHTVPYPQCKHTPTHTCTHARIPPHTQTRAHEFTLTLHIHAHMYTRARTYDTVHIHT